VAYFKEHFLKLRNYEKPFSVTEVTSNTKAVRKARGLAAVRCCYVEGGGDCYAKL
jgi:hypothetical protein